MVGCFWASHLTPPTWVLDLRPVCHLSTASAVWTSTQQVAPPSPGFSAAPKPRSPRSWIRMILRTRWSSRTGTSTQPDEASRRKSLQLHVSPRWLAFHTWRSFDPEGSYFFHLWRICFNIRWSFAAFFTDTAPCSQTCSRVFVAVVIVNFPPISASRWVELLAFGHRPLWPSCQIPISAVMDTCVFGFPGHMIMSSPNHASVIFDVHVTVRLL